MREYKDFKGKENNITNFMGSVKNNLDMFLRFNLKSI